MEGSADSRRAVPRAGMLSAQQVARRVGLTVERLMELADAGYAPHVRIDGAEPLFLYPDLKRWVDENLTVSCDGAPINDLHWRQRVPKELAPVPSLRPVPVGPYPAAVYFLCRGPRVVYVGQTTDLAVRLAAHRGTKDFDSAFYLPVPARDLDRVEAAFIRFYDCELNQAKGGKPCTSHVASESQDAEVLATYAPGLSSVLRNGGAA